MKGSCTLLASAVAASTVALKSSSSDHRDVSFGASSDERYSSPSSSSSSGKEKFTPRFDGLRFIETLVTAHR